MNWMLEIEDVMKIIKIKMIFNTIKIIFLSKVKIGFFSYADKKCKFENNVCIDRFCMLHNVSMGRYSYIGNNSAVAFCDIGRYTSISSNVKIGLGRHPLNMVSTSTIFYSNNNNLGVAWVKNKVDFQENKRVHIGNDVWIGANAILLGGINIGDGAVVGAGSVVTKDVEPYTIVAGNPAKAIKKRFDEETLRKLHKSKWWDLDENVLQSLVGDMLEPSLFLKKVSDVIENSSF